MEQEFVFTKGFVGRAKGQVPGRVVRAEIKVPDTGQQFFEHV